MEVLVNTSHVILPALYTALVIGYARMFTRGPVGLALFARQMLVGTVVLHLASVGLVSAQLGACPLGNGPEFLSLMALAIAVIYLIVELRSGDQTLGIFAITPAFVLQMIATVGLLSREGPPTGRLGLQASIHVFAAVVGFAAVAIAVVFGLLYLFLYAAIKRGRFGLFYHKMPSLEKLSDLNLNGVSTAFFALSVNIFIGVYEYLAGGGTAVSLSHPAVHMTILLWFLYGACLIARRFLQLGGKRLAAWTLVGLPFLVVIFVRQLFSPGFHS